jgi:chromosome segregation ATPase
MTEEFSVVNIQAAGEAVKEAIKEAKVGFTALELACAASASPTQEARELTRRWKTLYAKYANMSKRYWDIIKQMQALRLDPSQVRERYEALDAQFDSVCEEIDALCKDLEEWAQSGVG